MGRIRAILVAMTAGLCVVAGMASAQSSKQVTVVIGSDVGGGYDAYGRLLARHIGRFLPGSPSVTPSNMPGAAGLRMTNWLYNVAPKDGSVIAIPQNGTAYEPLWGNKQAQFDAVKLKWVGSLNKVVNVVAIWHERPIRDVKEAFEKEIILSGETGSDGTVTARLLNEIIGTKFKVVLGYTGTGQVMLAVVQGEVDGTANVSWDSMKATSADLLNRRQLRLLMQIAPERTPELGDTPFVMDFVKSEEDRIVLNLLLAKLQFGRPFMAPPGTSPEALRDLRLAFIEMSKDKVFLDDAARQRLEINPTSGEDVQAFIAGIYRTSPAVVEKGAALLRRAGAIGVP